MITPFAKLKGGAIATVTVEIATGNNILAFVTIN
jgi:hypothetical protein